MIVRKAPERGVVSVVIAGYNCASFIERTLRSVLDQTYGSGSGDAHDGNGGRIRGESPEREGDLERQGGLARLDARAPHPGGDGSDSHGEAGGGAARRMEILFVDDGSLDGTREVVERFAPAVKYLPVPHGGVSAARNAGVRATSGQYVALLDHDDLWQPTKIERQVAVMEAHPDLGLVFTRAKVVGDPAHLPVIPPPGASWEALFKEGIAQRDPAGLYARLLLDNFVPYSSILARRVAMPTEGPFKEQLRYSEDHDFLLRMAELKRFAFIPETLTTYTVRPGRATERMADMRMEDLAIFADNLHRNPWLTSRDAVGMRRREGTLLKEAGYWLLREGRGREARPILRRAWRRAPFDMKLPAYLVASLTRG